MPDVTTAEHRRVAGNIKDLMAAYRENEDLIQIGAYAPGTISRVDKSIRIHDILESFLRQDREEEVTSGVSLARLVEIASMVEEKTATPVLNAKVNK